MNAIDIKGISKTFGSVPALSEVSVRFEENKIYGLLGRNGAGKSTLLNVITGRIFADCGQVTVNGEQMPENDRASRQIYMMSETNYFPEAMKVREGLRWTSEFYPSYDAKYAEDLTARFGLPVNKKIKSLSTGYQSIYKLIAALSSNAPYILLDEPVLGLDANHRDMFYRVLVERAAEPKGTIIISTHLIEEVAGVIERVIIIKDGKIIKDQDRDELLAEAYTATGPAALVDTFIRDKQVIGQDVLGGLKSAYFMGSIDRSSVPAGLEISKTELQKLFVQLTNQ